MVPRGVYLLQTTSAIADVLEYRSLLRISCIGDELSNRRRGENIGQVVITQAALNFIHVIISVVVAVKSYFF